MTTTGVDAPRSVAPDHPNLQVRRHVGIVKERHLVRMSNLSPEIELNGFNNSIDTLERAVKERVFFVKEKGEFVPPPQPAPGHFSRCLSDVKKLLERKLPRTTPMDSASFVELYTGRKRTIYQKALESLDVYPITRADAEVSVFVKYEKTNFTSKKDPVPRVISPRSPRYNIKVGRYLSKFEPLIFKSLSMLFEGQPTVFKGMDSHTSGRNMYKLWTSFSDPVAVGLDASRFDQHVSEDALRWEHDIYKKCCSSKGDRRRLARYLEWQVANKCVGRCEDGSLFYTKVGGRMSGDMNTSLGNCILMCSMIKAYLMCRGVRGLLANNGDDCVVFMERRDLPKFSRDLDRWFRDLGFNMTVEAPVYDLEKVQFCQTQPVFVGPMDNDYLMVRDPLVARAKDVVCLQRYETEHEIRGWLRAVGEGGLAMSGGVPVMQSFYRCLYDAGEESNIKHGHSWGVRKLIGNLHRKEGPISPETRCSFWLAFDITPDEQLALEQYYKDQVFGPNVGFVRHWSACPL